jgi:hypothetical protein
MLWTLPVYTLASLLAYSLAHRHGIAPALGPVAAYGISLVGAISLYAFAEYLEWVLFVELPRQLAYRATVPAHEASAPAVRGMEVAQ